MPKPITGRTYLYHGNEVKITSITKMRDDLYVIETETKQLRVNPKDFKEFLPVEVPPVSKIDPSLLPELRERNKSFISLSERLMKVMDKVEADPKFIPQAKMMNETAKNVIAIGKAQIDFLKTIRK